METPEAQGLPRYRGETRPGGSARPGWRKKVLLGIQAPHPRTSVSAPRTGSGCLTRAAPLHHLHLASVLHMRLAFSLDTTRQMTRTKMRKFTCRAEGRATGGPLKAPWRPHPP